MVAAPAVEVTLGSSPRLETGRTMLYLPRHGTVHVCPGPFFFPRHAANAGNRAQLAADVRPRTRPEPRA